jgi:hypothetical protein
MKTLTMVIWFLLMLQLFGAMDVPHAYLLLSMTPILVSEFLRKSKFKNYFVLLFLGLFINALSCKYFRGQSIALTLRGDSNFFYILFYFVFKKYNFSIPKMEKILCFLAVVFCACYIVQFIIYPVNMFLGPQDSWMYKEEGLRIRMIGQGLSSLGYFFGLNKYLRKKKHETCYLLLSILCFGTIFLMGFRTMLAAIAVFSLVMIIRVKGFSWKLFFYGALLCGIFIGALQVPIFAQKMDSMLQRQKTEVLTNKEYVRVKQFQYFTQKHFKNTWEYVFGSGIPFVRPKTGSAQDFVGSDYGRKMKVLTDKSNINFVDFGLLSMSWAIGVPAVLAMIAYSFKAYRLKVSSDYYYLGVWFAYLVASSFTTLEFCRKGNFVIQALVLYLVEKAHSAYLHENQRASLSPSPPQLQLQGKVSG